MTQQFTRRELTVERLFPSGAWGVAAIIGATREQRTYYGYTQREAMAEFVAEFAGEEQ